MKTHRYTLQVAAVCKNGAINDPKVASITRQIGDSEVQDAAFNVKKLVEQEALRRIIYEVETTGYIPIICYGWWEEWTW